MYISKRKKMMKRERVKKRKVRKRNHGPKYLCSWGFQFPDNVHFLDWQNSSGTLCARKHYLHTEPVERITESQSFMKCAGIAISKSLFQGTGRKSQCRVVDYGMLPHSAWDHSPNASYWDNLKLWRSMTSAHKSYPPLLFLYHLPPNFPLSSLGQKGITSCLPPKTIVFSNLKQEWAKDEFYFADSWTWQHLKKTGIEFEWFYKGKKNAGKVIPSEYLQKRNRWGKNLNVNIK